MIQSIKMAWKSIAGNKFRAILTMLGIIIGVMALVILVSLVNGATSSVTDQINSLGSNLLTVTISDDKNDPITLEQLDQWMEEEDALGEMAASTSVSVTAKYGTSSGSVTVYGVTPSYFETQEMEIYLGRFLKRSDVDNNLNVCVITQGTASDLVGYEDCVGEVIALNGMKYTVVGIAADNESLTSMMRDSMTAYIPYTSLVRLSTSVNSEITTFYVSAPEGGTMDSAE